MNKRMALIVALATLFMLTSTTTESTNQTKFSTPEARIIKEVKINSSITPTQNDIPLTVIIPSKEVKLKPKRETIVYNGQEYYYRKVNIIATHYTNSIADCGKTDGISASGVPISRGMVAVPKSIPFGTEIILEDAQGNKEKVIAQDRGSAIKWINNDTMKIDVFVPNVTKKQINNLGVKKYTGYIIEKIVETP